MAFRPPGNIRKWNFDADGRALAGRRVDGETAIDQPDALLHAQQAQSFLSFGRKLAFDVEGFAVVFDLHLDAGLEMVQNHVYLTGVGVLRYVGETFLRDAKHDGLLFAVPVFDLIAAREVNPQAGTFAEAFHV